MVPWQMFQNTKGLLLLSFGGKIDNIFATPSHGSLPIANHNHSPALKPTKFFDRFAWVKYCRYYNKLFFVHTNEVVILIQLSGAKSSVFNFESLNILLGAITSFVS